MPSQSTRQITVLWAESERYKHPNVVVAYSESLSDMMVEEFEARVVEAKRWFLDFTDDSDGPWKFWTTIETITAAEKPAEVLEDA